MRNFDVTELVNIAMRESAASNYWKGYAGGMFIGGLAGLIVAWKKEQKIKKLEEELYKKET